MILRWSFPADDTLDNHEIQNIVEITAGSMHPDNSQQGWALATASGVLNI